jgi:hypothetical protein
LHFVALSLTLGKLTPQVSYDLLGLTWCRASCSLLTSSEPTFRADHSVIGTRHP